MDQVTKIKRAHFKSLRIEFISFFMSMILYGFAIYFKIEKLELLTTFFIIGIPILAGTNGSWSPKAQGGKFSWDFIYSLPLNKNEQAKLCVDLSIVSTFLLYYMLILCIGRFMMQDQTDLLSLLGLSVAAFIVTIPVTYISSYYAFRIQLNALRKTHQSLTKKTEVIRAVRSIGKFVFRIIPFFVFMIFFALVLSSNLLPRTLTYAVLFCISVIATYILYLSVKKNAFNTFHDYKVSYIDPLFKPIRDGLSSIVMGAILIFFLFGLDDNPERRFSSDQISQLVKSKSYEKLANLQTDTKEINKTNSYGYNPYMLSVVLGDLKALKILQNRGAKPSESVESNYRGYKMNAFLLSVYEGHLDVMKYLLEQDPKIIESTSSIYKLNALHISALNCQNSETVDYLISKQKQLLNSKSINGETALHLSARKGCLTNIVSLSNAGALRDIKTKDKKIAFDYIRKGSRGNELRNYFKKLDRAPASAQIFKINPEVRK